MRSLLLLLAVLVLGTTLLACASAPATQCIEPKKDEIVIRRDATGEHIQAPDPDEEATDDVCDHLYYQIGVHEWLPPGELAAQLCVINQCARCGRVLHECQRARSR
jgi:hypothetical protein